MPPPSPALARLRATTASAHAELDRSLGLIDRLADRATRSGVIARYWRLHATAEPAIAAQLGRCAAVDVRSRLRASQIAGCLGGQVPARPDRYDAPTTQAGALGSLYVLEGSTLGGRMILRALQARGASVTRLGFLDPYGAASGAMWRGLLAVLETALVTETALASACDAAAATFELARRCLADGQRQPANCGMPAA